MKQSTRLSSAVFQLTPTRTRCDLIIIAKNKKEKIASGLLNPFLAHLKTAQDQIAKGGYSILLEPETGTDAPWFTKGTLERFVRFVSTPEILERVYTIETEIVQIDEAIVMQSRNDIGQSIVENHQCKPLGGYEGDKCVSNTSEEKAIVLYTPGAPQPEANGSCSQEGNSKAQLLKVLESRKIVLQKEQGMAFARAVAAGFEIDDIAPLLSFAECFGAMRLLEACLRFIDVWKSKHETGQWLDIEASEAVCTPSDFAAMSTSGIILSGTPGEHGNSDNGKTGSTNNADNPISNGQQEYYQGQFPHLVFPPWPMHAPPGAQPVFQAYPVQGMPYYQSFPGNGPYFQPHHPMEHSPSSFTPNSEKKRQSGDVTDGYGGSDKPISHDDMSSDEHVSQSRKPRKKSGGSNKKQSGMVVIRNINYITSKEKKSGSETNSDSHSDIDTENEYSEADDVIHPNNKRSSKKDGGHLKSVDKLNFNNDDVTVFGKDTDDRHWQAFQDCLLKGSDEDAHADKGIFQMENNVKIKRHTNTGSDDPLALIARNTGEIPNSRMRDIGRISGSTSHQLRGSSDDFMIGSQRDRANFRNSVDPLDVNNFEGATKMDRHSSHGMVDENLIVPFRSMSLDQVGGTDRTAIDIDSEIPTKYQKLGSEGNRNRVNYEPNDLSFMPERGPDKRSIGYDVALDYEMQLCAEGSRERRGKEVTDVKGGLRKSGKDRGSKIISESSHKQRVGGPMKKGKPSKMSPLEDARARAESLRSYKAELQKIKKEKEEAEAKRLESLRLERQKRIAARGGASSVKPSVVSPQTKQLPTKLSPIANRGSKFSDSEPGSASPLQRSKIRTPLGLNDSHKASKASKLSEGSQKAGNRVSRSSSSLSETKRENINGVTPDSKASMSRIRRLSEPKTITSPPVAMVKSRSAEAILKRKLFEGPEKNKVSAIIKLDRSKAAALPELKIKTPKPHVNIRESRSAVKDGQTADGINPSKFSKNEVNESDCNTAHQFDADDNPIVEKAVVVLGSEKPSLTTLHPSQGTSQVWNERPNYREKGDKSSVISDSAPIHATSSAMSGADREPITGQLHKQVRYNEVKVIHSEKDAANLANPPTTGQMYQAPYARVSSLEDPCTRKSEYGKGPPVSTELLSRAEETGKAHVPEVKMNKNQVTSEKAVVKESSKGLRRLLKFARKGHSSSSVDQSVDSECTNDDGIEHDRNARKKGSTSEVYTLKNLISRDESSTEGNAPHKASRHFSLFAPFRSKTSEKKQAS